MDAAVASGEAEARGAVEPPAPHGDNAKVATIKEAKSNESEKVTESMYAAAANGEAEARGAAEHTHEKDQDSEESVDHGESAAGANIEARGVDEGSSCGAQRGPQRRTHAGEPVCHVSRDTSFHSARANITLAGQPRKIGERGRPTFQPPALLSLACGSALQDWVAGQPREIG